MVVEVIGMMEIPVKVLIPTATDGEIPGEDFQIVEVVVVVVVVVSVVSY